MPIRSATRMVSAALTALTALAAGAAAQGTHDPDTLRVALLPDEDAATVIQDNAPLAAHLEEALGRGVEMVVTTDYSSMIEAMRFGRIDVAYFGPVSYTIAKDRVAGGAIDIEPFAARVTDGATTYRSVLIANADAGIAALADVAGSGIDVAFGDPASTSSHYAPRYALLGEGAVAGEDYTPRFTGAHDAVARNVELGNAPIGGLSEPIFERLVERGTIDADRVVVLGHTAALPQYPWVLRTDLTAALQDRIRAAFLDLEAGTAMGDAVLAPFKAEGFAPIDDAAFDVIRDIRRTVQDE
ncbi:phosphate/phosphite/phosphonate ABC transporter substrate-binding protein [Jannaschia sp. LMIT008]|uniref:phosphate/phosphite/phosphonate ABC transporter substrate-binding protein n=1 Tax=Jannaschia maritima TaxID=3032585 RepID=UPI002810E487|nr:phosphate/phosphite/phosphonate ABC transporter substrate-binding protein [Jannaschia sp. LMIT008]